MSTITAVSPSLKITIPAPQPQNTRPEGTSQEKTIDLNELLDRVSKASNAVGIAKGKEDCRLAFAEILRDASGNLSAARHNLSLIFFAVKEEYYKEIQEKALDLLVELLENDPLTEESALGIVNLADDFFKELDTKCTGRLRESIVRIARVCAMALEVMVENGIHLPNGDRQGSLDYLKKAENAEDLFKDDLELEYLTKLAKKASRMVKTKDEGLWGKFIDYAAPLSGALSAAANYNLEDLIDKLSSVFDKVKMEDEARWYAVIISIKRVGREILSSHEIMVERSDEVKEKKMEKGIKYGKEKGLSQIRWVIGQEKSQEDLKKHWQFKVKLAEFYAWIGKKTQDLEIRRAVIIGTKFGCACEGLSLLSCNEIYAKKKKEGVKKVIETFRKHQDDKFQNSLKVSLLTLRLLFRFLDDSDIEIRYKVTKRIKSLEDLEQIQQDVSKIKEGIADYFKRNPREFAIYKENLTAISESSMFSPSHPTHVSTHAVSTNSLSPNSPSFSYTPTPMQFNVLSPQILIPSPNIQDLDIVAQSDKIQTTIQTLSQSNQNFFVFEGEMSDFIAAALGQSLKDLKIERLAIRKTINDDQANILARAVQAVLVKSEKRISIEIDDIKSLRLLTINLIKLDSVDLAFEQLNGWKRRHQGEISPGLLFQLGRVYENNGDYFSQQPQSKEKADQHYKKAMENFLEELKIDKKSSSALSGLARMYWKNHRYQEAIEKASEAMKLSPDNPVFLFNLAEYFFFILENFEGRKKYLIEICSRDEIIIKASEMYTQAIENVEGNLSQFINEETRSNKKSLDNIRRKAPKRLQQLESFKSNGYLPYSTLFPNGKPSQANNAEVQKGNQDYLYQASDVACIVRSSELSRELNGFRFIQGLQADLFSRRLDEIINYVENGQTVLCVFNISNVHWVTFAIYRKKDGKMLALYKDSMGASNKELISILEEKIAEFKVHPGKEQKGDGTHCCIMAIENMRIIARELTVDSEQFIANFESQEFCSLASAKQLRLTDYPKFYLEGIKVYEKMSDEQMQASEALAKAHQGDIDKIIMNLQRVSKEFNFISDKKQFTERSISIEIAALDEGFVDYCYRIVRGNAVSLEEIVGLLKTGLGWEREIDYGVDKQIIRAYTKVK